jgi:hypothetical protein
MFARLAVPVGSPSVDPAIIVALIALGGVLLSLLLNWLINRRLELRWRTEFRALEARTFRAEIDAERRDRRQRALETYRWAAELAVSDDRASARVGADQLAALLRSDLLDDDLKILVAAALESAVHSPLEAVEEAEAVDDEIRVLETSMEDIVEADVLSEEEEGQRD